ncbi:uncharacterized protein PGTG_21350 [Puccinia graminis f. sp. tritici CRL 75-36-700-3]|uniref:Uncharacterized protein n=2 Tax=Puccinia graminis f. sp. tritici TaxID=56615 RepID=H6QR05_PUCGT|nr:uncharacterized protein PGTG_21350 [Puccinia graminis f. sp. tritici CRL 75-36-700-3]EHS62984.1 hypothetical protein PGTG_21350 [Puccinia graminis f. sp. tritici CRL 75-36-700-3]
MHSDGDVNIPTQTDPLILCVSSETQPVLLNSVDFKIFPTKYSNSSTERHDRFCKTKIWKQSRTESNRWTINLISLSWSKEIWTRELNVFEDGEGSSNWTIQETREPILLKTLGDDLNLEEERPFGIVVAQDQFAVWSADRFWVFERPSLPSSNEKDGEPRTNYYSPSESSPQISGDDDLIVSLSFLGSFGILAVSKRHVRLFRSAGSEGTLNGWSEWKVRPIDEARFTLDSPCQFEFAISNSIVPSSIDSHFDLIKTVNLLTVDLDFSTGQRRFSELSFSTEAPDNTSANAESRPDQDSMSSVNPPVYPHRRDLYLSAQTTGPTDPPSICLTCSIWLEDDHRPTIVVGDSKGQLSVYTLNILSSRHSLPESTWKLERLVEEEQLGGPVSALYADPQWVLAGGVSGDLGVWARKIREAVSSEIPDYTNELRLVDRMMIGAVPVESFGRLSDLEHVPEQGAQSRRLSRFVVVMMDGSAVVLNLNAEGMIEVMGELGPPDTSLGISDLWSNGAEIVIFYRERELGAQRWLCSESLSAHLGRQEAKTMIEVENGQPLAYRWVRVGLSNCQAYNIPNVSAGSKVGSSRVVNISGMPAFNILSVRMREFVEAIGLQDGAALVGRLSIVRLMVSQLLPWGLDPALDDAAEHGLGIRRPSVEERSEILQVINGDRDERSGLALYRTTGDEKLSSEHSNTYRLLNLVVLLRVFLNEARYERHASETIVGLAKLASKSTSHLSDDCSTAWLDLQILVRYWLDPSTEVREAARLLFGVRLGSMANEEIEGLVASWQGFLPIQEITPHHTKSDKDWTFGRKTGSAIHKDLLLKDGNPSSADEKQRDAKKQLDALLLIGLIVSERYKVLSSKVLKDLSIAVFQTISPTGQRSDRLSPSRIEMLRAGFEICSKTFEIIQNYIDAIELVRNLFGWATAKDGELAPDLKGVAKYACLHVASVNTPLFMTTLSYDLSISQNPLDRISTMKLVVFMVRKRPLVLHTSLPRLLEAVIKSLDPTQKQMRAQTQTGATVILHELVKTYPSITFHGRSQKLAIGTPEGAIVIYDLKTGTKMDILESFRTPVVAASFSIDGQRLVAVSLDENRIEIWKFAGSPFAISSFFNFASSSSSSSASNAGPLASRLPSGSGSANLELGKHHHGSSKPFKSLSFNVGEEALMSIAGTLEWVRIEWLSERSCRLRIRQSSITFSC